MTDDNKIEDEYVELDNGDQALAETAPDAAFESATTTPLTDGQSRQLLQYERLTDPAGRAQFCRDVLRVEAFHIDDPAVNTPTPDGPWDADEIKAQGGVVAVLRGSEIASYGPSIKTPLDVADWCRIGDTVMAEGGTLSPSGAIVRTRHSDALIGGLVTYPGFCANEAAPIETDLTKPLDPPPPLTPDTAHSCAIVVWAAAATKSAPPTFSPANASYAYVRKIVVKMGDLLNYLEREAKSATERLPVLEELANVAEPAQKPFRLLAVAAAQRAQQAFSTMVKTLRERRLHFDGPTADVDAAKRCTETTHLSRKLLMYVYDDVAKFHTPDKIDEVFPAIPGQESARLALMSRVYQKVPADRSPYEALGVSLVTRGAGRTSSTAMLYVMPSAPVVPDVSAAQTRVVKFAIKVDTMLDKAKCGNAASDLVAIKAAFKTKAVDALKKQPKKPEPKKPEPKKVVVPAPTHEVVATFTPEATQAALKTLADADKDAEALVDIAALAPEKPKRKAADDGESKPKRKKEAAAEPEPPADDGWAPIPPTDNVGLPPGLNTLTGRVAARFESCIGVFGAGEKGFGPIASVGADKMSHAARLQIASTVQLLAAYGIVDEVFALIKAKAAQDEEKAKPSDAERKKELERKKAELALKKAEMARKQAEALAELERQKAEAAELAEIERQMASEE